MLPGKIVYDEGDQVGQVGKLSCATILPREMTLNGDSDSWEQLPIDLRGMAEAQLEDGESPLAWLELDLDARPALRPRIAGADARIACCTWRPTVRGSVGRWTAASSLRTSDQGSAGRLELLGAGGLICHWRYTIGRSAAAHRLAQRFERLRRGELSGGDETGEPPTTVCPSCGAILAASQSELPGMRSGQRQARVRFAHPADDLRQAAQVDGLCWASC